MFVASVSMVKIRSRSVVTKPQKLQMRKMRTMMMRTRVASRDFSCTQTSPICQQLILDAGPCLELGALVASLGPAESLERAADVPGFVRPAID